MKKDEQIKYILVGLGGIALGWVLATTVGKDLGIGRITPIPVYGARQAPAYPVTTPAYPVTYRPEIMGRAAPYLGWEPETPHF